MNGTKLSLPILILLAAILACNAPATSQPLSVDDQAATIIAATLQAQVDNASDVPMTATASATALPTSTPTGAATKTITPTYSVPMLKVLEQTNCREGPGQDYEVLFTYLSNKRLEIVGRYDPNNFWLVKSAESPTGTCWLWGEYVEVTGSYWVVPSVTPPATRTLIPPLAPAPEWNFSCSGGTMTFTMDWTDKANNETGYRVFRDGELVTELPANSTSFAESIAFLAGQSVSYYLQVYGPSGSANSPIMRITC